MECIFDLKKGKENDLNGICCTCTTLEFSVSLMISLVSQIAL